MNKESRKGGKPSINKELILFKRTPDNAETRMSSQRQSHWGFRVSFWQDVFPVISIKEIYSSVLRYGSVLDSDSFRLGDECLFNFFFSLEHSPMLGNIGIHFVVNTSDFYEVWVLRMMQKLKESLIWLEVRKTDSCRPFFLNLIKKSSNEKKRLKFACREAIREVQKFIRHHLIQRAGGNMPGNASLKGCTKMILSAQWNIFGCCVLAG